MSMLAIILGMLLVLTPSALFLVWVLWQEGKLPPADRPVLPVYTVRPAPNAQKGTGWVSRRRNPPLCWEKMADYASAFHLRSVSFGGRGRSLSYGGQVANPPCELRAAA